MYRLFYNSSIVPNCPTWKAHMAESRKTFMDGVSAAKPKEAQGKKQITHKTTGQA